MIRKKEHKLVKDNICVGIWHSKSMSSSATIYTSAAITTPSTTTSVSQNRAPPSPDRLAFLIEKSKNIKHLLQIHAFLLRHGLETHPTLNFKLQRSYLSAGRIPYSVSLFNNTKERNVFFYTTIIHGHAVNNLHHQALLFFVQMLEESVLPNAYTFSAVLKGCPVLSGQPLHCLAVKFGLDNDTFVRTALSDVYSRAGDVVSARKLFDTMPERTLITLTTMMAGYAKNGNLDEARALFDGADEKDVFCWNVMIDGYTQYGSPNEALNLFRQMLVANAKPNEVTMLTILSACGQLGSLELGKWVHSFIENSGIPVTLHIATALVDMYSKCGCLEEARTVFDRMRFKDVVAWNSMIVGYAINGFSSEALELFKHMCNMSIQPTDITFIGVLNACAHGGLVSEGWAFFNSMTKEFGINPKVEHYGCMVNLLGRAGKLDEAYQLVKEVNIDSDPVLLGTLLGACRLHKNTEMAEEILKYLIQHNLANSGTYILLSNIYAATGNWEGIAKVRVMMKESGVHKEPGCSSIEVNNKVYEFLAGDIKHPKSKEIYSMLEEINGWLKEHGYSPLTETVLHDIDDNEKQRSLEVHSEKIAIAFGLISTKPGTPIRIVKNLRICIDCHTVAKLISKITGRKSVVRDRNRFHHFVNGSCLCGDYW